MASALQAVFARLGSVSQPSIAPQLDANENNAMEKTNILTISDTATREEKSTILSVGKHITSELGKIRTGVGHIDVPLGTSVTCVTEHKLTHLTDITQGTSSASNNLFRENHTLTPLQPLLDLSDTSHFVEVTFTLQISNCVSEVKKLLKKSERKKWLNEMSKLIS